MPTTTNKKFLDLKAWHQVAPLPVATAANHFTVASDGPDQSILMVQSTTQVYLYDPFEDGYVLLPSPALAGTFGAGACGRYHSHGPSGTALAGSSATVLNTNLTLLEDLRPRAGRRFAGRVTGGTGIGQDFEVLANTTGPNSALTIQKVGGGALTTPLDATSVYQLMTGRFYVLNAGTLAAGAFRYFDYALKTWVSLAIASLPATIGTDSRLVGTSSMLSGVFATGTSSGANTTTTLANTAKAWAVNQWAVSQVRILSGTGAGQVRTVASNTATVLTLSTAWTITPDATSVYSIEGNDDHLYYIGNATVGLYRYSRSLDTWTLLAPIAARAAAPGAACSATWVYGCTGAGWAAENAIINGRRIYSFRGGGTNALDYYDIAGNTWVSGVGYGNQNETFNAGVSYGYDSKDRIVIQIAPVSGQPIRFAAFDFAATALVPYGVLSFPHGTVVLGDKLAIQSFNDGVGALANFAYYFNHTSQQVHRALLV
jgi:hypothetical protein